MDCFYSEDQRLHQPRAYVARGEQVRSMEVSMRADALLAGLSKHGLAIRPSEQPLDNRVLLQVHSQDYLDFLKAASESLSDDSTLIPSNFAIAHPACKPRSITAQAGRYLTGSNAPITSGTWRGVYASARTAFVAARSLCDGAAEAFALCRPPGHHAYREMGGGFCYINNAAVAAQTLLGDYRKVAILDVDVHHGNGTQGIFYDRSDVIFASLHADPDHAYPWYVGFADERGSGHGIGATLNVPLPIGTTEQPYLEALDKILVQLAELGSEALVLSLGFDTFEGDPCGLMALKTPSYKKIGRRIARFNGPVLLVQEGGYDVSGLTANLGAFLDGFLPERRQAAGLTATLVDTRRS